ncbi:MAG: hypothetical protein QS99_C0014G0010 [archaeon GW2011_AR4]|nr:MAG: hypothetical protein QS99_C0014G0010 [archaeon GW2011_AR4]
MPIVKDYLNVASIGGLKKIVVKSHQSKSSGLLRKKSRSLLGLLVNPIG